jgi:hypothetical protein
MPSTVKALILWEEASRIKVSRLSRVGDQRKNLGATCIHTDYVTGSAANLSYRQAIQ